MVIEHPVADMLTRIRNASAVGKPSVSVPYSKLRLAVAEALLRSEYVVGVEKKGKKEKKHIEIELKYDDEGDSIIHETDVISGPERRIYYGVSDIQPVKHGRGRLVLTTPVGVLTGEEAREENVGGEALFTVW